MKSVKVNTIITGIRAKVDGSLGLTISTPELDPKQKVLFMELQNIECETTFTPKGVREEITIEGKTDTKTPSQRLRSVLFILWKQTKTDELFDTWYAKKMEGFIDWVKNKLSV